MANGPAQLLMCANMQETVVYRTQYTAQPAVFGYIDIPAVVRLFPFTSLCTDAPSQAGSIRITLITRHILSATLQAFETGWYWSTGL
jgi:hypothetical protein